MRTAFLSILLMSSRIVIAQTDSISVIELSEAIVLSEKQTETSTHTVIIPTSTDKAHSSNAFDLIYNMNISELNISHNNEKVLNHTGEEVILCINGIEVSADEIATMRSKNVISIEFQRTPSGKYAGKGGVLNFKTVQYNHGGNIYISAKESFLYDSGKYLVATDYARNKSRLAVIYSNEWEIERNKQTISNHYHFSNGNIMIQNSEINPMENKDITNALNLRFSNSGNRYRLSVLGAFSNSYSPYNNQFRKTDYTGSILRRTTANNATSSYGNAFSMKANYTMWMRKDQIVDFTTSVTSGTNSYLYNYQETEQEDISYYVNENNLYISGTFQYFKTLGNGMQVSSVLKHYYSRFDDCYGGHMSMSQLLENNVSSTMLQLSKSNSKLYFYANVGMSNMNTRLNNGNFNYLSPTGYYGTRYTPKSNVSFSLNGLYAHTIFDLSYKNNVSVPTSFFEITQGNPNLRPTNVLSNTFEFNHHWQKTSLTASYMNYIYFNNIVHAYNSDDSYVYTNFVNDGNFYGNMLVITLAHRMLNDKLKISIKGIEEYNAINGNIYKISQNIIRGKCFIDYNIKKLRIGVEASTPYKALDIREPFFIENRAKISFYSLWDWSNWHFEAKVKNPFNKYSITKRYMHYPCFDMNIMDSDNREGRSIIVKAVFNFGYGKKTPTENYEIESIMNSAILKSY